MKIRRTAAGSITNHESCVSDHRAPHLAAIGPASVLRYASPPSLTTTCGTLRALTILPP